MSDEQINPVEVFLDAFRRRIAEVNALVPECNRAASEKSPLVVLPWVSTTSPWSWWTSRPYGIAPQEALVCLAVRERHLIYLDVATTPHLVTPTPGKAWRELAVPSGKSWEDTVDPLALARWAAKPERLKLTVDTAKAVIELLGLQKPKDGGR